MDYPVLVFVLSLIVFSGSTQLGFAVGKHDSLSDDGEHEDFDLVLGSTLTLLGLLLGFTFSIAVSRYDQRKNLEENEANAIGTEYVRTDLLPGDDAAHVRELLLGYLRYRIFYYQTRDDNELRHLNDQTAQWQSKMRNALTQYATRNPTAVSALVLAGMNDVLNAQGYTQAAWWNRVPSAAWILLIAISIFCNLLVGYGARRRNSFRLLILPIALSISLFLIADIDSPRGGVIQIHAQNLQSLLTSLEGEIASPR